MAPGATAKQLKLQKAQPEGPTSARFNFVYRADQGWVYTIRSLELATRKLKTVLFERQGTGIRYPDLVVTADSATYDNQRRAWRLWNGTADSPCTAADRPRQRRGVCARRRFRGTPLR